MFNMKKCTQCGSRKEPQDFKRLANNSWIDKICKSCRAENAGLIQSNDPVKIKLYSIVIIAKSNQFEVAANTFVRGKPKRYSRIFATRNQAQGHFEEVNQNNQVELNNEYLKVRGGL